MDMAELEIDTEDVHDKKKCCEEEIQPYHKTDYKAIIYLFCMPFYVYEQH